MDFAKDFLTGGLKALDLRYSPGRPHRLTPEQEQPGAEVVPVKTPEDVGFPTEMNWRAPLLRDYIQKTFEVTYSERGARRLLYRLGFACTRPTYTLAKVDPEKQAAFRTDFEIVKKSNWTARLIASSSKTNP